MKLETKLDGFKQFDDLLKEFPQSSQKRIAVNTVLAGARVARKSIRAAAKTIRKTQSIGLSATPGSGNTAAWKNKPVGPTSKYIKVFKFKGFIARGGAGAGVGTRGAPWLYWHEKGTKNQPARPFFLPAFLQAKSQIIAAMRGDFTKFAEREIARLTKKYGTKR
jgi:hypothetical protein